MADEHTKSVTGSVRDHAADMAEDAREAIESEARSQAEGARDAAADEAQKVANAADAASRELDSDSLQAQAVEHLATTIEDFARQVRGTDIDRVARGVSDFARSNPVLFVGGAALLGAAATRFLKAKSPRPAAPAVRTQSAPMDDPWAPYETAHPGAYPAGSGRKIQ
jgi:uncharacterized protein YjbJ (UPF0337 family)